MISQEAVTSGVLALFDEAYSGPAEGAVWFTDGDDRSGFAGLLAGLSAEEASRPLTPGDPLTIASHAGHVAYALALAVRITKGADPFAAADWKGSWSARQVTEAEWKALIGRLAADAAEIRKTLESGAFLAREEFFTGFLSIICHGAWHLGALHQGLGLITAPA